MPASSPAPLPACCEALTHALPTRGRPRRVSARADPVNYLCLLAFTLTTSVTVGVVCAIYRQAGYEDVILQALLYTAVLVVGLTLWALQSSIPFDFCIAPLMLSLMLLLVAGAYSFFLQSSLLYTAYCYFGALVFCIYIVVDTKLICERLGYDDYIVAAIELYLDIVHLFLFILRILGSSGRS